ncbi:retron Ec67 family RNA-directed DNA polymerase/endonuclease [Acetobacterium woodii]|uniref:RNA-directed DNA polymerase n=1 Tax=Acetobacterium woodii (strain ATCC 29683 / DSM 1030 / JCM 2381 / KCTC 1655 / WB1) TaxID=931626 RepID=H6LFL0_ACEWD|nr:retron Ec67 family RNA-directed DNA polymerase/endonuclease [Acetobacterium woodii]AFA46955.1 RNA-directed DNA polymerase [Acetobacterium woodii DSM 1030]
MNKFNEIKTRNDLADFLDIPRSRLTYILYGKKIENFYTSFEILKKNGGTRQIDAPNKELKIVQKKIANALWNHYKGLAKKTSSKTNFSHAFEKEKSIITNAKIHRNKRFVLNIDLEDFFHSFHFGRVRGFFEKNNNFTLPKEVATVMAQLVCYEKHLPQGAPSSPIITNLICNILDFRMLKLSRKYKFDYTRYADDLTFSSNNKYFLEKHQEIYDEISNEIERAGFRINERKTRLQYRDSKQQVTGLVVNKKINVDRVYYKKTRAMAFSLYSCGSFEIEGDQGSINQLEGRFAFINQLDRYNNKLSSEKNDFRTLNSREKQYQQFLYYKYFFANKKPLIVTEGKTDVRYLKAAMKSLCDEYPNLITKSSDTEFEFKVSFLRRTKRLNYFLNITQDGADTISSIYKFSQANNEKGYINYLEYFKKISNTNPKNPVILIFDNELNGDQSKGKNNKNKPLQKFINLINLDNESHEKFKNSLSYNILGNFHLLTNQLVNNKDQCEIEDLIESKVWNNRIGGKTFSIDKEFDLDKHFGKEIFSQYIEQNYETIDFENFKPILDNISQIIDEYNVKS